MKAGSLEIKTYILHSDTFFEFQERRKELFEWGSDQSVVQVENVLWSPLKTADEVSQGQLTSDTPEFNIPFQHHLVW